MKAPLHISDDLSLPLDAVTQTIAFLARKGAGKTYGATKLAEEMLDHGAQVVGLDPVGVWWGLRLAADGKHKGLSIPVLGGLHGDIPLEPGSGALVADLVVDRGISVVLDVSMFRKGERKRFATDFAEQLFHRKKSTRSAIHLFVEEAQVFVPQRVQSDEARMLGAFEDLVKLGRNFGIGVTLISQRPQSVNKDALSQTECLFVLQTNGAQERKALRDWIVDQGMDVGELVDALPGLKKGEAYVWSPSWLRLTKRIRIAEKATFNASATPEVGKSAGPAKELAPVDLEQVREAMAATIERAKAEDPKALQKRIRELEAQLAKAGQGRTEVKEVPVLTEAQVKRLEAFAEKVLKRAETLVEAERELEAAIKEITPAMRLVHERARPTRPVTAPATRTTAPRRNAHEPFPEMTEQRWTPGSLPKGARDMLRALASTLRPSLSKNQVAMLAGLKVTGGTFAKYLSILTTGGFIRRTDDGVLAITPEGEAAIGGRPPAPSSTQELLALWKSKLPGAARDMLDVVVQRHPQAISRQELAAAVEPPLEPSGGTFAKYLSLLRTNGLVESHGGELVASDSLFLSGAA